MPSLARLSLLGDLSPIRIANGLSELVRPDFVAAKISDIVVPDMELPLADVTAVLTPRVMPILFQFLR